MTCEFITPLTYDIVEARYNRNFEEFLKMNNFDDICSNIKDDFIIWLDELQEIGLV